MLTAIVFLIVLVFGEIIIIFLIKKNIITGSKTKALFKKAIISRKKIIFLLDYAFRFILFIVVIVCLPIILIIFNIIKFSYWGLKYLFNKFFPIKEESRMD